MAGFKHEISYPPRGLRVDQAADYVGMSRSKFLELVNDGRMPGPIAIDGLRVWDRLDLDAAFDDIKGSPDRVDSFEQILAGR